MNKKKKIAKTTLVADLFDLQLELPSPSYWTTEFILEKMKEYTLQKFRENQEFWEKLDATGEKTLKNQTPPGRGRYDIVELIPIENYDGTLLMNCRTQIRKENSFTKM